MALCTAVASRASAADERVDDASPSSAANGSAERAEVFPPDLVPILRLALPEHPALARLDDATLARLLTLIFFASLEVEETELHPLRIAFIGSAASAADLDRQTTAARRWTLLPFLEARSCDPLTLVKLARATASELVFIEVVAVIAKGLRIVGLLREGVRLDDDPFLKIIAPGPGTLEIWSGGRRVVRYVRGQIQAVPENLLLTSGPVRRALNAAAQGAGVPIEGWPAYLDAVAGLVRGMASHHYGGILAVTADAAPDLAGRSGFRTAPSMSLAELLADVLRRRTGAASGRRGAAHRRTIDRQISEIGRLTALDGATVLDRSLAVRGFGLILPISEEVPMMEAADAEGTVLAPFVQAGHGARHRAAAAYAYAHPGAVVFLAAEDGDLGCMIRETGSSFVLVWRFRPSDIPYE